MTMIGEEAARTARWGHARSILVGQVLDLVHQPHRASRQILEQEQEPGLILVQTSVQER